MGGGADNNNNILALNQKAFEVTTKNDHGCQLLLGCPQPKKKLKKTNAVCLPYSATKHSNTMDTSINVFK
jgi:hypothetical protein